MSGTITAIELFDPPFDNGTTVGNARQTITIEAGAGAGQQGGLAAAITTFLSGGLGMVAGTFTAWDLAGDGFHHMAGAVFDPAGLFAEIELQDASNATIGFLRIEGTNLTDASLTTTGAVTKIINLDQNGDPILGEEVTYAPAKPFAMFEYGLLSLAIPDPEGGLLGNDEAFYQVLVAGNNTITDHDQIENGYSIFDGGLGTDNFVSDFPGGYISHDSATAGVTASLDSGTSTGGAGSDTWDAGAIGGLGGSSYNDTLSGSDSFGSDIFGWHGDDTITAGTGIHHDYLDGGTGNDTITAGDGDDAIFGGTGNDVIHGGANAGDNSGDPGEGLDDVLFYSRIDFPTFFANRSENMGEGADEITSGIIVTYTGTGTGTVTGGDWGSDTFDCIESVWGSQNADTFDLSGAGASTENTATGMAGNDTFTGGAGFDIVSYDDEVFEHTLINLVIGGTFTTGISVNMDSVVRFGLAAGTATDLFGDTDTLADIDSIIATSNNDRIAGNSLDNTIIAHEGNDLIDGGAGNDRLEGRSGNDDMKGGAGADLLLGEDGDDILDGGTGDDVLLGGDGNDSYFIDSLGDITIDSSGFDTIYTTLAIAPRAGFEKIVLLGTANLKLSGGTGKDNLTGNDGNNVLAGGRGKDTLTGGLGADDFDFNSLKDTGKTAGTRDVITDFKRGVDDIDLKGIDANTKKPGNQAFKFIGKVQFHKDEAELHFFKIDKKGSANDRTIVEGDVNGDGRADFQIELIGLHNLNKGDFIL